MEIYRTVYPNELMHSNRLAYPNELYHHGILGQKWGKRNGPPYPLDYSDHSAAEKRLMYGNRGASDGGSKTKYGQSSDNTAKSRPSKAPKEMMDDIIAVNGGKGGKERSYLRHNNCAFCSVSYEMRRRGYDVRAQEAADGVNDTAIYKAVKDFDKKSVKSFANRKSVQSMAIGMTKDEFNELTSTILKDGDNSRGQVLVDWKAADSEIGRISGGHALNYEVKDGVFYLVDGQVGKAFSGKEAYEYLSNAINVKTNRTDNVKMNTKITEKYYTEQNTGRVANDRKIDNAAANLGLTAIGFSQLTTLMLPLSLAIPPLIIPTAVGLVGTAATGISAAVLSSKGDKIKEEKTLAVENKWQKENRHEFYTTGKEKSKKEDK